MRPRTRSEKPEASGGAGKAGDEGIVRVEDREGPFAGDGQVVYDRGALGLR